ncbi:MAG: AAA family ATPase [Azospirillaceae bacterium]
MSVLLRRVFLKNFKSIANAKVDLQDLTLLVGPNGSGKSNFIDALRLVSDALNTTPEYAIRQRGGINEVRRRSGGHPTHFAISLRLNLGGGRNGLYAIRVGAKSEGAFSIQREHASVSGEGLSHAHFEVRDGKIVAASDGVAPHYDQMSADRLFLTAVSGLPPFRPLYDALTRMGFYSINPEPIKELQVHDSGQHLDRSGWNLAAVIKRLGEEQPGRLDRIQEYLARIVPGIEGVDHKAYGPRETLEFRQTVQGQAHPWRFHAANMSDGTLRSLGVLTALFHQPRAEKDPVPFVAIEEPEVTIHPGAAAVIMDALIEASAQGQVLATTHSPDLLDHGEIGTESILTVESHEGETRIRPADPSAISMIRQSLYTIGELHRLGQLTPADDFTARPLSENDLFRADR